MIVNASLGLVKKLSQGAVSSSRQVVIRNQTFLQKPAGIHHDRSTIVRSGALLDEMTVVQDAPSSSSTDQILRQLQAKKKEWTMLSLDKKIELLDAVRLRLLDKMQSWGKAGAELKGGNYQDILVLEMVLAVVPVATYINRVLTTLRSLRATGKAPALASRTTPSGQLAVKVFPANDYDKRNVLFGGVTAELLLLPGEAEVRQAALYGTDGTVAAHDGRVCAILGPGNQGFITVKDALVCLVERGEVVVMKPHPLWKEWQHFADYVLEPFIKAGYVRSVYLDTVRETQQLLYSSDVDCVHMTGGTATHDAIVWGSSEEERERRRRANDPVLKVPMTSELGCVTPFILPPWPLSLSQLRSQAGCLVSSLASNNGCNCNSTKVLVMAAGWEQGDQFLQAVRDILKETQMDPPYYPGLKDRYRAFKERYPHCEVVEARPRPVCRELPNPPLPYLLNVLDTLPTDAKSEYAFNVEPFAPVLTVVKLPASGPSEFLRAATAFANEQLWGSLSCMLVLHPDLEKAYPQETQQAVADLRYGTVSVNTWSAATFLTGATTWGAFAGGQTLADVGSGLGVVGNPYLVEGIQKVLFRAPMEGQAVTKPPQVAPVPPPVLAKVLAGYMVDGLRGIPRALWAK